MSTDYEFIPDLVRGIARRWPAFSAYLLAPTVAIACLVLIIKNRNMFSFFPSEGSAAGLVVPIFMWAIVILGFVIAGLLFFGGLGRLEEIRQGKNTETQAFSLRDSPIVGLIFVVVMVGGFYLVLDLLGIAFELLVSLFK